MEKNSKTEKFWAVFNGKTEEFWKPVFSVTEEIEFSAMGLYLTNFVILSRANFRWVFEVFCSNSPIVIGIKLCLNCVQTLKSGPKSPINWKKKPFLRNSKNLNCWFHLILQSYHSIFLSEINSFRKNRFC